MQHHWKLLQCPDSFTMSNIWSIAWLPMAEFRAPNSLSSSHLSVIKTLTALLSLTLPSLALDGPYLTVTYLSTFFLTFLSFSSSAPFRLILSSQILFNFFLSNSFLVLLLPSSSSAHIHSRRFRFPLSISLTYRWSPSPIVSVSSIGFGLVCVGEVWSQICQWHLANS